MAMGEFPLLEATPLNWKRHVSGSARYVVVNSTFVPSAWYWKSSCEHECRGRVACNEPTAVGWCAQINSCLAKSPNEKLTPCCHTEGPPGALGLFVTLKKTPNSSPVSSSVKKPVQ